MRALIYTRVSTQEQAQEGISLDNQLAKIKAYCFARDWEVIETITDEGKTGKNLKRPGLQKVIAMAKNKEFDVLVVYKLDRLIRSTKYLGYLIEDIFEKYDIAFTSVTDNFDTSTANGKLILNILGSVAQWERDIISERTTDAISYKKSQGEVYGAMPYGFTRDGNKLVENPQEINNIVYIKDLKTKGFSIRGIASELKQKGICNRRGQTNWGTNVIQKILKAN